MQNELTTPVQNFCPYVCVKCQKLEKGYNSAKQLENVTHGSTVARTVMCRQDGRGRFPVLLDDHSKCRTNSQRKSQLS